MRTNPKTKSKEHTTWISNQSLGRNNVIGNFGFLWVFVVIGRPHLPALRVGPGVERPVMACLGPGVAPGAKAADAAGDRREHRDHGQDGENRAERALGVRRPIGYDGAGVPNSWLRLKRKRERHLCNG